MTRILISLALFWLASSATNLVSAQEEIDFGRDILPIFADHCFACHGPDAATREGGFRLDEKASVFGEADSGEHPVVAGDRDASEILRRMRTDDDSEVMPPAETKKRPTIAEIGLLERWITSGATWQEHWAFIAPQRPELPVVKNEAWIRNPIDRFVLAKLESLGKTPAKQADKTTVIRRVCLDLTGLPPSPRDVDRFLNDRSPDAYEKLVDRLLDSPQYGEHMATFWLDAARFADTNGYQNDFRRSMWLWRDWVIKAYNDNMPFDQFTIEQLAGDMLPDATLDQKIATGFNRNHRSNTEGGSINEEWLVENVVDRVETTATVFLGLTMGCARCHDHKYDPISQREFYEFFSYFHNVDERGVYTEKRGNAGPVVSVPNREFKQKLSTAAGKVDLARGVLDIQTRMVDAQQPKWEKQLVQQQPDVPVFGREDLVFLSRSGEALPANVEFVEASLRQSGELLEESPGDSVRISGEKESHLDLGSVFEFDASRDFAVSVWVRPDKYGAIISRMDEADSYRGFDMLIMPDGRMNVHLIHDWPKNATKVTTKLTIPKKKWTHVVVVSQAPGMAANLRIFMNGRRVPFTTDSDTLNGSTVTKHPFWIGYRSQTPEFAGLISSLRIWTTTFADEAVASLFQETLRQLLISTADERSEGQQADIDHLYQSSNTVAERLQLQEAEQQWEKLNKQLPTTMVMKELTEPRQTYVLKRGQYDLPDIEQPVSAGIPSLFKSNQRPTNRLELAQWLVDENNPLTARVAINHFWARYFGTGILETPENFGVQSPPPSHPQLLDWLATEFVRNHWNVKQMQKLIVTSASYRQSSAASPEAFAEDPRNRLLSRGPRFRLPAESIRDNALAISRLLNWKIGGPSIKPYQPEGLWEELAGGAGEPPYTQETGEDLYRRSLYIYRKRTVPHPTMTTFDGVGRDVCAVSRDRTNTPLQALALLNDPTYVEAARHLAILQLNRFGDHDARLQAAFHAATCRWPREEETSVLQAAYDKYHKRFSDDPDSAKAYVAIGQSGPDDKFDAVELAAYASVCSVILNLDEVITKE